MVIERCLSADHPGWFDLRRALWPEGSADEHRDEMATFCARPDRFVQFVARETAGPAMGFVEAALRSDYVNGTDSSPVAFLEGIYVAPPFRGRGVARALVNAVEHWARGCGCSEFASDAALDNERSHAMHRALGFAETERVVYFRKPLA
ncbi:MAG TPA: aminoglycoside 6'-N-acetyltransferase [Albitalea sp.]